jgi:hypothetical protein
MGLNVVFCGIVALRWSSGKVFSWPTTAISSPLILETAKRRLTLRVVRGLPSTAGLSVYARTQRAGVLQPLTFPVVQLIEI